MKNKYLFKTIGFVFTLGLLLLGSYTQAQNRSFLNFDGDDSFYVNDASNKLDIAGSDWTIELWVYPTSTPASGTFPAIASRKYSFELYFRNNGSDLLGVGIVAFDGSGQGFSVEGTLTSGSNYMTLNHWHHIAVSSTKPGSTRTTRLFIDGTQVGSSTDADFSLDASIAAINFGARYDGGYIRYVQNCDFDEFRYSKTARYTAAFTPAVYDNQFVADANTILLYHFNEGTGTSIACDGDSDFNTSLRAGPHDAGWKTWNYYATDHLPLAHEWDGTTSDWATAGNWFGGVPDATTDVLIPLKSTDPTLTTSTTADCRNLLIEGSATLTINSDATGTGSLIIHGTFTNVGSTVRINRYMTAYSTSSDGWHFLSAPVSSFAIAGSGFEPTAGNDDLYEYDETATTDNWLNYTGGTFGDANFVVGKGYLCAYKAPATTKQFTGDINAGTVTKNLSYTSGASSPGWNLLGNPYTAAIDWDLLTKSASVDGAVYVVRASDGAYISWNGSAGDLTGGIIPAMQGYFVKTTAASQSVTMEAADEVHATGTYYKTGNAENTLVVKVTGEKGESNAYIQFREDATKTFDHAIDAYKLFGYSKAPQIYTNDGENIYSINCLPLNIKDYVLPLAVKTNYPGDYTLDFTGIDNLAVNDLKVKLTDLKLNTTVTISEGDTYAYTTSEGDDANRFELEFYSVTGINNPSALHQNINIYASNSSVVIRNLENKNLNGQVSVLNLLGQVVYTQQLSSNSMQTLNTGLHAGVYIVRLSLDDNSVMSKKLIIR